MKPIRKIIATGLCAAALVGASVLGTMAYFTDNDVVTNTFTVGKVDISLDELDVDHDSNTSDNVTVKDDQGNDTVRDKANEYHLLPGHKYDKDPMVTVLKGSENSYVRMQLTITKSSQWDTICAKHKLGIQDFFLGYDSDSWILKNNPENNDNTRTYEFWYKEMVSKESCQANDYSLPALFTQITIPGVLDNDDMKSLEATTEGTGQIIDPAFKIEVTAQAIQADGFDSADNAWEHFPK